MKIAAWLLAPIVLIAGFAEGAGHHATLKIISGANDFCGIEVDGKLIDLDNQPEIQKALKPIADRKVKVLVEADESVPYRCLGGAIYTVQLAGIIEVSFVAAPPDVDEPR